MWLTGSRIPLRDAASEKAPYLGRFLGLSESRQSVEYRELLAWLV